MNLVDRFPSLSRRTGILFLVLGSLFAYLPALLAFFVKDDLALITSARMDFPGMLIRSWPGGFFRPVAESLFALEHSVFAFYPLPYHLLSLAAHAVAAFLVYRIFHLLLNDSARSLAAAFLFTLHPLHTESVSWISGQMSLFSGLCALLVVYMLSAVPPKRRLRWAAGLVLVFAAGLGFYENFIVVPALWVVILLLSRPLRRPNCFPALSVFLLLAGIAGVYLYWRFLVLDLSGGYYDLSFSLETGLINLVYYFYLLNGGSAIGGRIIRYHPEEILSISSLSDVVPPLFLANTLLFVAAGGLFISTRMRQTPCAFLPDGFRPNILLPVAWIGIALLPAFFLAERPRRIAYLAVPGYAFAISQAFFFLKQKTRLVPYWIRAGWVSYFILMILTLHLRNHDWWTAGNIEENLPESISSDISECPYLAFDVPNLLGDALFFNCFSTQFWLQRKTGKKNLTVLAPQEILRSGSRPEKTCYFRFGHDGLEPVHSKDLGVFPSFGRGKNWMKLEWRLQFSSEK